MADFQSPFATGIAFLDRLGVYEVLLPFLLIFTIVFAILEKSKIFGTETVGDTEYSKKNLNSMFSFVTAFIVVASSRLVAAINEAVANMTILLLLGVSFLILAGVFHTGPDEFELKQYRGFFMVIMLVGILAIFLHALRTEDGTPWLFFSWNFIVNNLDTGAMGALILTIIIVLLMGYVTGTSSKGAFGLRGGKKEE